MPGLGLGLGLRRRRKAGGAAVAGILDAYTGAAYAFAPDVLIYSAHSVTDSAVGSQTEGATGQFTVRVRRSSDNAVRSFLYSEVSDGTLLTWVGAGEDGFVICAYDQGTGGNHAVQATAANQPKIVDAGVLVVENGKVALDFDDTRQTFLDIGRGVYLVTDELCIVSIYKLLDTIGGNYLYGPESTDRGALILHNGSSQRTFTFRTSGATGGNGTASLLSQSLSFAAFLHSALTTHVNGSLDFSLSDDSANFSDNYIQIGGRNTSTAPDFNSFTGRLQLSVIYTNDSTVNRTPIETILNNTYTIY